MTLTYQVEPELLPAEFQQLLHESGLAPRRPTEDMARLDRMLRGANLIVTARADGGLVGIARCVTDWAFCCYLSDLAVSTRVQGQGIGKRLIEETRSVVGPSVSVILLAAPAAVAFYEKIGMPRHGAAFWYKNEN